MQFCEVTVRNGGSLLHTVPHKIVSVPEIRVLQKIHGPDAVVDIRPFGRGYIDGSNCFIADAKAPFDHDAERQRLSTIYETNNLDEEGVGLVARIFGAYGPLPERLSEIGIDPRKEAEELRQRAEEAAKALEVAGAEIEAVETQEDVTFDEQARARAAQERRAKREGKTANA